MQPLWLLTRGAVAAQASDTVGDPLSALSWGLGRVVAREHAERWGGLIDLPDQLDDCLGSQLLISLCGDDEDQIALREAGRLVRRLRRVNELGADAQAGWTPEGTTVLVSGGTGAVGAQVAHRLAEHGAAHLVLMSRRGGSAPGAETLRAELESRGSRVYAVGL